MITQSDYKMIGLLLLALIAFQIVELIRFLEITNKRLYQFLQSIRHADFSTSFSDQNLGKTFENLNQAFTDVIEEFKKYRVEKIEHYNYLQTVVQHATFGIIAYKEDGKVDLVNNAVKRLLNIPGLRNISELKEVQDDLPEILFQLKTGDTRLLKIFIQDELRQLSVKATEFRMRGEDLILITLQDIHTELEEKEVESWQKLIRVLTHEIMNSITPISSLAGTVNDMLIDEESKSLKTDNLDEEDIESIQSALSTIKSRSEGLLNFVETYRNLTRIPKPNFRYISVKELFKRVEILLTPKIQELNISFNTHIDPETLMLTIDPDLMDQVLINMVLNAIDAVKQQVNPEIKLLAFLNPAGRLLIEIKDNGTGIKPDIIDKIFMPFFTSKSHGSGIGLSLSRQIMHIHKGNIGVKSRPNEGTVFTLSF
ncbi:MAG: hypothetical protein JEZ03_03345 [Bacteroidales bacterium]|nr:hypothetical protein [Bacteroidales bacterium]